MDIEHLKLILETLESAGQGASNALIWYLVFQLIGKLIPYTALSVVGWFIAKMLARFMAYDDLMRQFGYDPELSCDRHRFQLELENVREQIKH